MMSIKPNLFIVGAGKAGTSALHNYLSVHPDIYMSPVKEPNFFGRDLQRRFSTMNEDQYLQLFSSAAGYLFRGEASVDYMLSKTAAMEIKEFAPESRILIMVRNPVEVIQARHAQNLYCQEETIADLACALQVESERREGRLIPDATRVIDWLYYREWVKYSEQVSRYFQYFGKENVFVGVFDDLRDKPRRLYENLMQFLGVDGAYVPDFKPVNSRKAARIPLVSRIARGKIKAINPFVKAIIPSRRLRQIVSKRVLNINSRTIKPNSLDPLLAQQLRNEMQPEVEALSNLLGRDLTHWLGNKKY